MLNDILHILRDHWPALVLLLGMIASGVFIAVMTLRKATANHFTTAEYFSIGFSAWPIPVFLWALLAYLSLLIFKSTFLTISLTGLVIFLFLLKSRNVLKIEASSILPVLLALLLVSIAVNMAFLSRLIFPAYFDSAEHYRLIRFFLQSLDSSSSTWPRDSYYHIGYHLIVAAIVKVTGFGIIEVMLVLGQLALSTLAIPLFFIISRESRSNAAGLLAVVFAGFGWYMPGHALNWGKYPAIFGLICTIFVINLLYLVLGKNSSTLEKRKLIPILLIAIVVSGILHTRSIITAGLFALSLILIHQWERLGQALRRSIFGAFLFMIFVSIFLLRSNETFGSLLSSYLDNDFPALSFVLLMGIFAVWKFPKLTFTLLLFLCMLWFSLSVPMYGLFGYSNLFLLDRPYAQLVLYIPFSLLGGLGIAGFLETIGERAIKGIPMQRIAIAILLTFLAVNAIFDQKYYPSNCCQLVGTDDLAAFSWIQEQTAPDANLLIASQDFSFTPDTSLLTPAGMDAGVWVSPITNRYTLFFSSHTDFSQDEIHLQLCNTQIHYVYIGNQDQSFNEETLIAKPEWYQKVFDLPQAKIYQLIGCP